MQTKEQIQSVITALKARKLELKEESEIVDQELFRNLGRLSRQNELEAEVLSMKPNQNPQ